MAEGSEAAALASAYERCLSSGPALECRACPGRTPEPSIEPPPFVESCAAASGTGCTPCEQANCCDDMASVSADPGELTFRDCQMAATDLDSMVACFLQLNPKTEALLVAVDRCSSWSCIDECSKQKACDTCMKQDCPKEFLENPTILEQNLSLVCNGNEGASCGLVADVVSRQSAYALCQHARCSAACGS